jgi:hypothetical protein
MVTKNKNQSENAIQKGRVTLGKLQLGKETIKDLTPGKQKEIKGGFTNTWCKTCSCRAPC